MKGIEKMRAFIGEIHWLKMFGELSSFSVVLK